MKLESLDHVTAALAAMRTERIHQQSLTAELNAELAKVKNRFEPQIQKHKDAELAQAEAVQAYFDEHRAELLPGKVKIEVTGTYKLADAAQAHRDLEGRKTTGSIILEP